MVHFPKKKYGSIFFGKRAKPVFFRVFFRHLSLRYRLYSRTLNAIKNSLELKLHLFPTSLNSVWQQHCLYQLTVRTWTGSKSYQVLRSLTLCSKPGRGLKRASGTVAHCIATEHTTHIPSSYCQTSRLFS